MASAVAAALGAALSGLVALIAFLALRRAAVAAWRAAPADWHARPGASDAQAELARLGARHALGGTGAWFVGYALFFTALAALDIPVALLVPVAVGLAVWQAHWAYAATRAESDRFQREHSLSPIRDDARLRSRFRAAMYAYWLGWFGAALSLGLLAASPL